MPIGVHRAGIFGFSERTTNKTKTTSGTLKPSGRNVSFKSGQTTSNNGLSREDLRIPPQSTYGARLDQEGIAPPYGSPTKQTLSLEPSRVSQEATRTTVCDQFSNFCISLFQS